MFQLKVLSPVACSQVQLFTRNELAAIFLLLQSSALFRRLTPFCQSTALNTRRRTFTFGVLPALGSIFALLAVQMRPCVVLSYSLIRSLYWPFVPSFLSARQPEEGYSSPLLRDLHCHCVRARAQSWYIQKLRNFHTVNTFSPASKKTKAEYIRHALHSYSDLAHTIHSTRCIYARV